MSHASQKMKVLLIARVALLGFALCAVSLASTAWASKAVPTCTVTPPDPVSNTQYTVTYTVPKYQHPALVEPEVYISGNNYNSEYELPTVYEGATMTANGTALVRGMTYRLDVFDEATLNYTKLVLASCFVTVR